MFQLAQLCKKTLCRLSARSITTASKSEGAFATDLSAYSSVTHGVTPLNGSGLIRVTGKDSAAFLQGLVTNDVVRHSNTYNALLAPNGRYSYDCFISLFAGDFYIETESAIAPDLVKHLKRYRLR